MPSTIIAPINGSTGRNDDSPAYHVNGIADEDGVQLEGALPIISAKQVLANAHPSDIPQTKSINGHGGLNGHSNDCANGQSNGHAVGNGIKLSGSTKASCSLKGVPPALADSIRQTQVEYKQVGQSGLRVSDPILGTLCIGDQRWKDWILSPEEAENLLLAAYSKGINTWDTANAYSNGMSEAAIGCFIKKYDISRRKLVLMTKVGRIVADAETSEEGDFVAFLDDAVRCSKDYVNQYGLSRSAIFDAVDQSLERLQTTYIDVLHIHRFDPSVPPEETMRALHDLVSCGKVRYLAASSMWAFELATLQFVAERNGWTKFVAVQNHYSLLYREEEREVLRFCRRTGLGVIPWSPLAEGFLARPLQLQTQRVTSDRNRFGFGESEADRIIIKRVQEVADRHGWTMCQVALLWLKRKGVTAPVVGLNSIKRMDEALCLRGQVMSEETEAFLDAPYQPKRILGHS